MFLPPNTSIETVGAICSNTDALVIRAIHVICRICLHSYTGSKNVARRLRSCYFGNRAPMSGLANTAPAATVRSHILSLEKKSKMLSHPVTTRTTLQSATNESNQWLPDCVNATYSKMTNICKRWAAGRHIHE